MEGGTDGTEGGESSGRAGGMRVWKTGEIFRVFLYFVKWAGRNIADFCVSLYLYIN